MKTFLLILFATIGINFGADGDLVIPTANGAIIIKAADAAILKSHWDWLDDRYAEASAIKIGSTYGELTKHFKIDGGLHVGGSTYRFVHNLAPRLKLDVTFERDLDLEKPDPKLKIRTVSRPYLDQVLF